MLQVLQKAGLQPDQALTSALVTQNSFSAKTPVPGTSRPGGGRHLTEHTAAGP